ncbi:MAG: hypothetical protein AVDCRST_MAG73-1639 [uncultured Thermomicrobiales bacterium]|uniref:DUF697 domain-containing protein n=1 Tax=uncultured Thermomicrobiales bacterium TaxID=1645740 RepID=A0A6J4U214_9BACT|nr:MAG: hypothetical protein AVDCRST_MAG73-1639 [uncultured Thermomicrobiales bacterium]
MPRAKGQRFGAFGTLRSFVSVVREMSFDDVRDEMETKPRLLVIAPDEDAARALGDALGGDRASGTVVARALGGEPGDLMNYDAVVVHDPDDTGAVSSLRRRFSTEDGQAPVFNFPGDGAADRSALDSLRATLVSRLPERAPALGRAFPAFRAAATKAVIDETAKANAQFALVSNIPSIVPVIGSLASAGADTLVLTKNQLMLLFKIAGIHGRDLHDQWGIMREMAGVVGAGMLWRTLAREAASFIPLAGGTIPKVAIAYAGTVTAGRAADFYYRFGDSPSKDQVSGYYQQAVEAVKKLPLPLPGLDGGAKTDEAATEPTRPVEGVPNEAVAEERR